eukprot:scaffold47950_cov33-Tisochrysis_lutea.AAC.2
MGSKRWRLSVTHCSAGMGPGGGQAFAMIDGFSQGPREGAHAPHPPFDPPHGARPVGCIGRVAVGRRRRPAIARGA